MTPRQSIKTPCSDWQSSLAIRIPTAVRDTTMGGNRSPDSFRNPVKPKLSFAKSLLIIGGARALRFLIGDPAMPDNLFAGAGGLVIDLSCAAQLKSQIHPDYAA
jgi:hypothetical protein